MLQIIDQRWRDHLAEMDYLREGINLRAMGQQDPLVAWQREGFSMFGQLMDAIDDDYLRYVLHVEAGGRPAPELDLAQAGLRGGRRPGGRTDGRSTPPWSPTGGPARRGHGAPPRLPARAPGRRGRPGAGRPGPDAGGPQAGETLVPVVKAPNEKLGRNDPCWCGSGKKFKLCHGAA